MTNKEIIEMRKKLNKEEKTFLFKLMYEHQMLANEWQQYVCHFCDPYFYIIDKSHTSVKEEE